MFPLLSKIHIKISNLTTSSKMSRYEILHLVNILESSLEYSATSMHIVTIACVKNLIKLPKSKLDLKEF